MYTDAVREAAWNEYSRMFPLPDVEARLSAQLHTLFYKVVVTIDSSQDFYVDNKVYAAAAGFMCRRRDDVIDQDAG